MGDARRFALFADVIAANFPDRSVETADVAAGKGYLRAALYERGFRNVTSWDKRPRQAKPRSGYRYGWFDHRSAPRGYRLVVGMHPDEGTDEIIAYAAKHRVPFCVCPCCVKPRASAYWGAKTFAPWVDHLVRFAQDNGMDVSEAGLPMTGRNLVLIGRPSSRAPEPRA